MSETPSSPLNPDSPSEDPTVVVQTNEGVINTASGGADGLERCPKCGATEVVLHDGKLTCQFCRHSWLTANAETTYGFDSPIDQLKGLVTGSGSSDIDQAQAASVTIKCEGCGAEVVINTANSLQARCHWCRHKLSLNTQIPNGAVPDAILPFTVSREDAVKHISDFAGKRKFFALKRFREEFLPENVMGVYMPYMAIDGNLYAEVNGIGEEETRRYTVTVGSGDNKRQETRYDADVYRVSRKFDMLVDDLQLESSAERSRMGMMNTNNVINAILPFDVKNAHTFSAQYMVDHTSEKRDMDVKALMPAAEDRFLSMARSEASRTIQKYDRGVRWESEHITVKGSRWVSVYVPVWLYSYYESRGEGKEPFVHYIAVNGRTGKTMGSVPVNKGRLALVSLVVGTIATVIFGAMGLAVNSSEDDFLNGGDDFSGTSESWNQDQWEEDNFPLDFEDGDF